MIFAKIKGKKIERQNDMLLKLGNEGVFAKSEEISHKDVKD